VFSSRFVLVGLEEADRATTQNSSVSHGFLRADVGPPLSKREAIGRQMLARVAAGTSQSPDRGLPKLETALHSALKRTASRALIHEAADRRLVPATTYLWPGECDAVYNQRRPAR